MALPGFRALGTSQRWAARFSGTSCTDGLFQPQTGMLMVIMRSRVGTTWAS